MLYDNSVTVSIRNLYDNFGVGTRLGGRASLAYKKSKLKFDVFSSAKPYTRLPTQCISDVT